MPKWHFSLLRFRAGDLTGQGLGEAKFTEALLRQGQLSGVLVMETAQMASHVFDGVPQLVRGPVLELVQLIRQVKEAAADMRRQLVEVATLALRVLDGVALQATQMRARSQVEMVFGRLTVSFASGLNLAKEGSGVPE